jgi:hypothetical protein
MLLLLLPICRAVDVRYFASIPSFAGDIPAVTCVIAVAIVVFWLSTGPAVI